MTLYEFALQASQDEDLAKIAKAIPSEVQEIRLDERQAALSRFCKLVLRFAVHWCSPYFCVTSFCATLTCGASACGAGAAFCSALQKRPRYVQAV